MTIYQKAGQLAALLAKEAELPSTPLAFGRYLVSDAAETQETVRELLDVFSLEDRSG